MEPLVSIGMSVFNGEKTLAAAIRSVINQTYKNWELIIIDDGSNDNSLSIANSFDDNRIKVFHDGHNKNLAARLNETVEYSEGVYFARMDQDDISAPDRLEKQVAYMEAHPDVDLLGTSAVVFNGDLEIEGVMPVHTNHHGICCRPWNGFHVPHPSWFGRRSWFLQNNYRSSADRAEDQDLLFRTYRDSNFACLKEALLGYRQESRPLKKLFLKRVVVMKSFSAEAINQKDLYNLVMVLISWPVKVVADILNSLLKDNFFRSRLCPTAPELRDKWRVLIKNLSDT